MESAEAREAYLREACASATVLGGKIYIVGGGAWNWGYFSTVEAYDPATDTWTAQPSLNVKRFALRGGAANGRIYAIGGTQEWYPGAGLGVVEEYDPKPKVSLLRTGGTLTVYWNGILESIEAVSGSSWQTLHPSAWPYSIYPVRPWKFSRAREL